MSRVPIRLLAIAASLAFVASDAPASAQTQKPARAGIARAARDVGDRAATSATLASTGPFTVVTFNAGLAPGAVARSTERSPLVMEALREEPFDVLCAQEVWLDADYVALRAAVEERAPHLVRTPRAAFSGGSCQPQDVALLETCHRASCADAAGASLSQCMVAKCAHLALSLPSDCVSCLTREPWKSLSDARRACTTSEPSLAARASSPVSPTRPTTTKPLLTGGPLAFGGSDGVVLASRYPFASTATLRLPSAFSQRVVHHARIASSPVGPLDVFCTHLSAHLGSIPYPGRGTWDDEHVAHVGALVDWIEERTRGAAGTTIVAGDLNMGPRLPGRAEARRATQFERLLARGFVAPHVASQAAGCTYCNDNPLTGGSLGRTGGTLLDHVLVRGWGGGVETKRVLVTSQRDRVAPAVLSDHYGLAATFRPRSSIR